jgi:DNA replication protein DnaC
MNDTVMKMAKQLRLGGLLESLDVRLQEAKGNNLSHEEFLELILQDELNIRQQRLITRRIKTAAFRDLRTLEDFDFSFNPSIKRKQIFDLASCRFIREQRDVLFVGPPGVGKSHIAQAVGYHAIKANFLVVYRSVFDAVRELMADDPLEDPDRVLRKYLKPDLLIIDDMGLKHLPPRAGEHLFEVIMRRYENRSTLMTSNRPIEEWGKLIGDVPSATAILDRFLHHAEIINIRGKSYRLKDRAAKSKSVDKKPKE